MASDIELDPFEFEFVLGHTRSSYRLGTPLGSEVGKIRVMPSVELGIQARPRALPV